ncbi:hypothetical protein ACIODW_01760 [Streptomyces sp. NPDC087897]|uniref:hypothetical protein n=1 Tax=Streptomyces sp. NPDC087897 TaxID=3365817 RepID=UPI00381D8A3E
MIAAYGRPAELIAFSRGTEAVVTTIGAAMTAFIGVVFSISPVAVRLTGLGELLRIVPEACGAALPRHRALLLGTVERTVPVAAVRTLALRPDRRGIGWDVGGARPLTGPAQEPGR